jgi:hypothetical protein
MSVMRPFNIHNMLAGAACLFAVWQVFRQVRQGLGLVWQVGHLARAKSVCVSSRWVGTPLFLIISLAAVEVCAHVGLSQPVCVTQEPGQRSLLRGRFFFPSCYISLVLLS